MKKLISSLAIIFLLFLFSTFCFAIPSSPPTLIYNPTTGNYEPVISGAGVATTGPLSGTTGTFTGAVQGDVIFNSYSGAQTLTEAVHNGSVVQMTVAGEVTMWDATATSVGNLVTLWARDAEKIEVVPASGDHFVLLNGSAITEDYELDCVATAGNKVTLICTAENTWSIFSESDTSTDGGVAD